MDWISLLQDWWGVLVIVIAIILYVWAERKEARDLAYNLLREVEAHAREYGLETLDQKRTWVYKWYDYLPPSMTALVSEKAWRKIVDYLIDRFMDWGRQE